MSKKSRIFILVIMIVLLSSAMILPTMAEEETLISQVYRSVYLSVYPSGTSSVGQEIVLRAFPVNINNPEYQFGWKKPGGSWNFFAETFGNVFYITPQEEHAGGYIFGVRVRERGLTRWGVHDEIYHRVLPVATSVILTADPPHRVAVGKQVTFTAKSTGVIDPRYVFYYSYDGVRGWKELSRSRVGIMVEEPAYAYGPLYIGVQELRSGEIDVIPYEVY